MSIRIAMTLLLAGAVACGSGWRYVATDGSVTVGGNQCSHGPAADEGALASAAHDIPCPPLSVALVSPPSFGPRGGVYGGYVVEGCGQRVTYQVNCSFADDEGRYLLLSRVPLPAPAQP